MFFIIPIYLKWIPLIANKAKLVKGTGLGRCCCLAPTAAREFLRAFWSLPTKTDLGAKYGLLQVCAWESPVGGGGGAQRDLTTRNLRENRQS